jgi:hypothetical protein
MLSKKKHLSDGSNEEHDSNRLLELEKQKQVLDHEIEKLRAEIDKEESKAQNLEQTILTQKTMIE